MDVPCSIGYSRSMKQPAYLRCFNEKAAALEWGVLKNQVNRAPHWRWVIVDGPAEDTWCVVDLDTAIEHGNGYST